MEQKINDIKITDGKSSIINVSGELALFFIERYRARAIARINSGAEIPGFRKGKVPDEIIYRHFGELNVFEEAAKEALGEAVRELIEEKGWKFIAEPEIHITKIAPGSPVAFSLRAYLFPIVTLPDYKKIATEKNRAPIEHIAITDKEIEGVMEEIRKSRSVKTKKEGGTEVTETPELTDTFLKTLGNFSDVQDFKKKIQTDLLHEKAQRVKEKRRIEIVEAIVAESTITLPEPLIDHEVSVMEETLKEDISRFGLSLEKYLIEIKKTMENLRKEWRPDAAKKAKWRLIVAEIAKKENLYPTEEAITSALNHLLEQNGNADRERARRYVTRFLTGEKVFAFLETQMLD